MVTIIDAVVISLLLGFMAGALTVLLFPKWFFGCGRREVLAEATPDGTPPIPKAPS